MIKISSLKYDTNSAAFTDTGRMQSLYDVYRCLSFLEKDYPGFRRWYWLKVIPGVFQGDRKVIIKKDSNTILGVSILKKTAFENKICTLWVNNTYRGKGIGRDLLSQSIDSLEDHHPLISVSEHRIAELRPLLSEFNFHFINSYLSIYQKDVTEYSFNGFLMEKESLLSNAINQVNIVI